MISGEYSMINQNKLSKEELQIIWKKFITHKKTDVKNILIEYYFPFVQKIAVKVAECLNWKMQADELASLGLDGLYDAIENYDMEKGVPFEQYANRRIRGSMIDGIRRLDNIPRSIRLASDEFQERKNLVQNEVGHRISDADFVNMIGMDEIEFHRNNRKYIVSNYESIESSHDEDGDMHAWDLNDNLIDHDSEEVDRNIKQKDFFMKLCCKGNLDDEEKKIVYFYYYKHLTMDKIADKIGLSESRVSQKYKKIRKKIKREIKKHPKNFEAELSDYIDVFEI